MDQITVLNLYAKKKFATGKRKVPRLDTKIEITINQAKKKHISLSLNRDYNQYYRFDDAIKGFKSWRPVQTTNRVSLIMTKKILTTTEKVKSEAQLQKLERKTVKTEDAIGENLQEKTSAAAAPRNPKNGAVSSPLNVEDMIARSEILL